jgi:uncharacterized protein (DUF924 family)
MVTPADPAADWVLAASERLDLKTPVQFDGDYSRPDIDEETISARRSDRAMLRQMEAYFYLVFSTCNNLIEYDNSAI